MWLPVGQLVEFDIIVLCKCLTSNLSFTVKMGDKFYYSKKYFDDLYEYRHVVLSKELVKKVPRTHLMSEDEWRALGVQMSSGWIHYMHHTPEPHILLFKRPLPNSEKKLVNGSNEMKVIENNC